MIGKRSPWCNIIGIILGLAVVAPPVTMLFDRRTVLTLDASESSIEPNPVTHGMQISIRWTATEHRNCGGTVIPRIIDSSGRTFEYAPMHAVYHDLMVKSPRSFEKSLTLPIGMAPGPAKYQAVVIRWCNVVQQYLWPMIDEPFPIPFEVVP